MEEDILKGFEFEINNIINHCLNSREITAVEYMFIKQTLLLKIEDLIKKNERLINKYKEQEKTIQLMSEELAELNYEYCGKWCKGKKCKDYYENHFIDEESCNGNKLSCIIDYFKKKAR